MIRFLPNQYHFTNAPYSISHHVPYIISVIDSLVENPLQKEDDKVQRPRSGVECLEFPHIVNKFKNDKFSTTCGENVLAQDNSHSSLAQIADP
jgi:hypothetical protein